METKLIRLRAFAWLQFQFAVLALSFGQSPFLFFRLGKCPLSGPIPRPWPWPVGQFWVLSVLITFQA